MKSYIRASKASGSDKRKVDKLIRRGWRPGLTYGACLSRTNSHQQRRVVVAGGHYAE